MKLTNVLGKQHLGRMFNFHWYLQGKKRVGRTRAKQVLEEKGFVVEDAVASFGKLPQKKINFNAIGAYELPIPMDENHPSYSKIPCYTYNDGNVLVGGLEQAAVLTKTIVVKDDLPVDMNRKKIDKSSDQFIQRVIQLLAMFDAEQKKLPKRKDPERPAWVFPRDYGITDVRKKYFVCMQQFFLKFLNSKILCKNLALLCTDPKYCNEEMSVMENGKFRVSFNAHGKQLLFELTGEILLTSRKPMDVPENNFLNASLPNIHPLHPTISLGETHFFTHENFSPLKKDSKWPYIHTAFLHANPTEIKNIYETAVSQDQLDGRALIKGFSIASAQAKSLQMIDDGDISKPIAVKVVQTDGHSITFGLFVLNTLNIDNTEDGKRNVFWVTKPEMIYTTCKYISGRPVFEGYNLPLLQKVISFST